MSRSENNLNSLANDVLSVQLGGEWQMGCQWLSIQDVDNFLADHPNTRKIIFDSSGLISWDTSVVTFLIALIRSAARSDIRVIKDGLPRGIRQLIALAAAVPKTADTRKSAARSGFLENVGSEVRRLFDSAGELMSFIGSAFGATLRMVSGKTSLRSDDLRLFIQDTGPQAVPIVSLISFLVGLILAFIGMMQLKLFGAQVYVADLVGIGMVRELGAIMTGIIMAGRTGAAFAAQIGTMQVNEEIDALKTLGISPMEFLILPRMLALTLMMPLLVLYANLMGILGGALVSVGLYDVSMQLHLDRTLTAVGLNDLFIGLFMGIVFGVLVSLAGCMRGMACERSASAVGTATTSAVVTGIVAIIIATAVITVLCDIIGV